MTKKSEFSYDKIKTDDPQAQSDISSGCGEAQYSMAEAKLSGTDAAWFRAGAGQWG